jgi:carboxylesterase type B
MKTKSLLLALFSLFFSELVIAQQPDPVMTDCGLIQGMFENGLTVYKGVPFAAPPVGELRWKAPQPMKKMGRSKASRRICSRTAAGTELFVWQKRRLSVSECLVAGQNR